MDKDSFIQLNSTSFIILKNWNESKCPILEGWICYIHWNLSIHQESQCIFKFILTWNGFKAKSNEKAVYNSIQSTIQYLI